MIDEDNECVGCIVLLFFFMLGGIVIYIAMRAGWIS